MSIRWHLGTSAFDSIDGEVVQTTAFATTNVACDADRVGGHLRLVDGRDETEKARIAPPVALRTTLTLCASRPRCDSRSSQGDHRVLGESADIRPFRWGLRWETAVAKVGLPRREITAFPAPVVRGGADRSCVRACDREDARASGARWFPTGRRVPQVVG